MVFTSRAPKQGRFYDYDPQHFQIEERVARTLTKAGFKVEASSRVQNIQDDVDLLVGSVTCSIKNEQSGLRYGHVYVELVTQIPNSGGSLATCDPALSTRVQADLAAWGCPVDTSDLGRWFPAWWYTGTADCYLIVQGSDVLQVSKEDLSRYLAETGPLHLRGLSPARLRSQSGRNTVCAYMSRLAVPVTAKYDIVD